MKRILSIAALCVGIASLSVAALTHEIPPNLAYFRVTDAAGDRTPLSDALQKETLILDLRFVTGKDAEMDRIAGLLTRPPPGASSLRIVILNTQTSPALVAALAAGVPRQLTIAPSAPEVKADIAVNATAEDDRRAYEALGTGVGLDKLMGNNLEKRRFDEAALARNHGTGTADLPSEEEDESPAAAGSEKKAADAAPHDAVLERALQIARALRTFPAR